VGKSCERGRFWAGSEREPAGMFCLPVSSNSCVISVIMQISTSVPRTTEVAALKPTAATLQEAIPAPVSQDTPGTESAVQVRTRMSVKTHAQHYASHPFLFGDDFPFFKIIIKVACIR